MVATCVKFQKGKFKNKYVIYNDYYGSCSGCDSWEDATDENVRKLCIDLSNSAFIFKTLKDVKAFLQNPTDDGKEWSSWSSPAENLLRCINSNTVMFND